LYSSNNPFILLYYFTKQQTLSVTRPLDSSSALYYKWSIVTMRLSGTDTEIWRLKDNGVTSLTFGVMWRHRSRDHSTHGGRVPMGGTSHFHAIDLLHTRCPYKKNPDIIDCNLKSGYPILIHFGTNISDTTSYQTTV